ncbi:MAG: hypothetical protein FKY71_19900, partial [Spiribacter salinus]
MGKIITAALAAFIVVSLSACETIGKVADFGAENVAESRLAVKAGTLRFVEEADDRQARAQEVAAFVDTVREQVDSSADSTIDDLVSRVRDEVPWESLDSSEQLLVDGLITRVRDVLQERVGDGVLDEQAKVRIGAVLDWAREATELYG